MGEVTHGVESKDLAELSMEIGGKTYWFVNKHYVARLAAEGFEPTRLEWDIRNPDRIIEHGRMNGIQPGRGIIATPDRIEPKIKKEMDSKYGEGNWKFVEIKDSEGHEFAKPLIKPRKQ